MLVAMAVPLAGATGAAGASTSARSSGPASTGPVTITVTSMSPSYAKPGQKLTITGTLRNNTTAPLSGLSVQLTGSSTALGTRTSLEDFAAGTYTPALFPVPNAAAVMKPLAAGASATWTVTAPVDSLGLSCFGVYPLAAAVTGDPVATASAPIALPFWPAKQTGCVLPRPEPISWIWPLIDSPRQAACPSLTDTGLQASLEQNGRLGGLLGAAAKYDSAARLTLAIDPALLTEVTTMTAPYAVGTAANCSGAAEHPASAAARSWLASLTSVTNGQAVLLTPYSDVDLAALTSHGMTTDMRLAFQQGQRVGHAVLPHALTGASGKAGSGPNAGEAALLSSLAWPADGQANLPLLENLASLNIGAVILDSSTMPVRVSVPYTPGAVTTTPSGVGTSMNVLLSDHELTTLLGTARASATPGADFAVRNRFLAETAMIAAEVPTVTRTILVAPPRRWNPSPGLASGLLAETVSAPWLRPSTLTQLLSLPDHLPRKAPSVAGHDQLSNRLMRQLAAVDQTVSLVESLTPGNPNSALYRALFAAESSAWRGPRTSGVAWSLTRQTAAFAAALLDKISISGARKVILGGTTGSVLVSVRNQLPTPVQVRIEVGVANTSVKMTRTQLITVPAATARSPGSVKTIKLQVQAAQNGSAKVRISLTSPAGQPLPIRAITITVQATQFGTLALIIGAAALAVFVLASAFRAIRNGRGSRAGSSPGPGEEATAGPRVTGMDAGSFGAERSALRSAAPGLADLGGSASGYQPTEGRP